MHKHVCDWQIEEQMLFGLEPEATGPPSKRRAVGNRTQGSSTGGSHPVEPTRKADAASWGALAEVYGQLGQDDLVQVIHAKCLSRFVQAAVIKPSHSIAWDAAFGAIQYTNLFFTPGFMF